MRRVRRAVTLTALALASLPSRATAQAPTITPAQTCDDRAAADKRAWARNAHGNFANVFHKQTFETGDTWCRIWETTGADRRFKAGDFGRVLFSGDGIHPAVASSLVPGSGLAVGASVSFGRALQTHDVRLSGGADGRYSTNGSWTFGGRFEAIGSGDRPSDVRHNNGTVFAEKRHLAQLTNFGRGNDSPLGSPAAFAMDQTTAGGAFEFVTPQGVRIAAGAAGVSTRTVSATAPNLTLDATHFVYGARVHVVHPGTSITHGNQIDVAATAAGWQEVHGRPYDFARVDVAWLDHYTPRTPIGTFAVMGHAALAFVSTGQAMPFFAQPTLGGTDLDGTSSLRSFSDYRFRAPNALTGSIEHELDLVGPIGSLLFADAGRVSDTRSGLGSGKFHHSFGAGIALRLGNTTVFRLFYAWGGGEGTRTTMTGSSDSFVTKLVGKGPF